MRTPVSKTFVLRSKVFCSVLATSLLLGYTSSWAATSIGANFIGRGDGATFPMLPSDNAGVVPQIRWNNIDSGATFKGTSESLSDSNGNFYAVKVIYDCSDSWSTGGATTTPNERLMKGIIKANPTPDVAPANNTERMLFVITNLPAGSYNVLVYLMENDIFCDQIAGSSGTNCAQATVTLGATSYYVEQQSIFSGLFIKATSTTVGAYTEANYAEFIGVAPAGNGTITFTATKNIVDPQKTDGIGVAGIQIVQVSGSAFSPNTTPCSITAHPQGTLAVAGGTATFTAAGAGPCSFKWTKNGVDIPGAIDPTLVYTPVLADDGAQIRAVVFNNVNTNISNPATLLVDAPTPPTLTQGFMTVEQWQGIGNQGGSSGIADLKTNVPGTGVTGTTPTRTFFVAGANVPVNSPAIDNFGNRIWGWVRPDVSGDYDFFIRSDDSSELYINAVNPGAGTNTLPDVQTDIPVCAEYTSGNPFQEPPLPTATATPIPLVAGRLYGIVILAKDIGGGDYAQVAWRLTTDTTPAALLKPIPPHNVWTIASSAGHRASLGVQPKSTSVVEGRPATFSVSATTNPLGDPLGYGWLANNVLLPAEQTTIYKIPITALTDDNKQIKARIYTLAGTLDTTNAILDVIPDTFPPIPLVGTIVRNDGAIQVGIGFDEAVNTNDIVASNFSLIGGTSTITFPTNSFGDYKGVLFNTTGLIPGNTYTAVVSNVRDVKGNAIPVSGTNVPFTVSTKFGWADTGTPKRPGQVIPVGADGFDVLNGGRTEWGTYDEATIAYVMKTNDFDVKLQVIYAEPGSQWTRVGLAARNALNVGQNPDDRNNATNSPASAYAQTHVNPSQTLASSGRFDPLDPIQPGNPTPNNGHEQNVRLATGAATTEWQDVSAGAPLYPNVWLRLARTGTNLAGYASSDGVDWALQGTTSLTDQQPHMFVGPVLSVETGNIWPAASFDVWTAPFDPKYDRLFVAQFRNFTDTFANVPTLSIARSGANIVVTFTGTLQSAPVITGPYTNVPTASPYNTTATGAVRFFRSQN